MSDDTMDWEGMSPREKLESPRGQYLIATALHYAVQQISRFPEVRRADRDCEDMRAILNGCFPEMAAEFRANDRRWARSTSRRRWTRGSVLSAGSTAKNSGQADAGRSVPHPMTMAGSGGTSPMPVPPWPRSASCPACPAPVSTF